MEKNCKRFGKVYSIWHIHIILMTWCFPMVVCSITYMPVYGTRNLLVYIKAHYRYRILIAWIFDDTEWTNRKIKKTSVLQRIEKTYCECISTVRCSQPPHSLVHVNFISGAKSRWVLDAPIASQEPSSKLLPFNIMSLDLRYFTRV